MAQDLTTAVEGVNKGELFTSFDVDAFEVPHGRDEIWRFTPLRRLRGLHDGSAAATGSARIEVTERPGVTVETVRRGDERLGQGRENSKNFLRDNPEVRDRVKADLRRAMGIGGPEAAQAAGAEE